MAARRARHPMRLLVMALLLAPSAYAVGRAPQLLVVGASSTITTDYAIGDAAITNPGVCDYLVRDSRTEVYLNARQAGAAMLTLWDAQGVQRDAIPIQVSAVDLDRLAERVRDDLQLGEAVQVRRQGERLVIEGEVAGEEQRQAVLTYVGREPLLESRVRIGSGALRTLAHTVAAAIKRPGITVRTVRDRLVLEGIAYSPEAAQHAEAVARLYHDSVLNLIEIRDTQRVPGRRPLVQLDVHFLEVKRGALRAFGIQWNPGASSGDGGAVASAIGFVTNLLPKLRLARERGEARVLEQPTLVVKSGERGELFSGTEIPYTTEQNVQFKNVGVSIQAEPIVDGDHVDLKIDVAVSAPSAGVDGAIDRRTVATSAYCRNGQSLVLGQLWEHSRATTRNRTPRGAQGGSAIAQLAWSKDFQSRESEFLVFVTPRIVDGAESLPDPRPRWDAEKQAMQEAPRRSRHGRAGALPRPAAKANPGAVIAMPPSLLE